MNRNIHIVITLLNAGIVKYILYWLIYSYIFYLHTKFQMPSSSVSLVIAIKVNVKYRYCVDTILLLLILKKITFAKVVHFSKLYYHTKI